MTTADDDRIWLPHVLFELAEAFGLPLALRFAAAYGGRRLQIPAKVHADHPVARDFGAPLLAWMIERWGSQQLPIPLGPHSSYTRRIGEIRRLLRDGEDAATIVRMTGCHERTIYRHRRTLKERDDGRQGALDLAPPLLKR